MGGDAGIIDATAAAGITATVIPGGGSAFLARLNLE
jgi:hypothetical protein